LPTDSAISRDELTQALHERNIGTGVHYRAVHLHPYYRDAYGLSPSEFPVASRLSDQTLSLPLGPTLSEADQDDVVGALTDVLQPRRSPVALSRGTRRP
jgi:dTDP-4-amino-4,6-dideoxygalactose transaminase